MTSALVISGHGSHLSPQTAAPAWQHANAIRAMGVFDEVTCAFWREAPSLHRVLDTLTADDITIVPLFTSQGYFSRNVLPTEFGLDGLITQRNGRVIRYTETVGQHPHMADVVAERVESVIAQFGLDPAQTALALAGHGTQRDPDSAAATRKQAEIMRATGRFAEVVAVYMEEPPEIERVYEITHSPSIIVVPFFVADGSHTQEDIPRSLRLTRKPDQEKYAVPSTVSGRAVYYTPAVGMESSVAQVILDLARAAGAPLRQPQPTMPPWTGFPSAGLEQLQSMQFPFPFGQVLVESNGGQYVVHHVDEPPTGREIENPLALHSLLSRDANGNFRALPTQTDLVGGWAVRVDDIESLLGVIETIYPTAWIDFVQHRAGTLPIQRLEQVVARQTGIYKQVQQLTAQDLPRIVGALCGLCVRQPTWFSGASAADRLPCPEPCQCWMSFALQQVSQAPSVQVELSPGELASLRSALQMAIAEPGTDVRPADYDDPRNPARLRALLALLALLAKPGLYEKD